MLAVISAGLSSASGGMNNLALVECVCRERVDGRGEMHTGPVIERIFNS